tara:strand:+ start:144 stop:887 length:744 start_codon:yes stop_codon:yes gene_type:complete
MIYKTLIPEIKEYFLEKYPEEACVFITPDGVVKVDNIHSEPESNFKIDQSTFVGLNENALAFIHSHPDWYPVPSERDMRSQISSAIPWGIISVTKGQVCSDITWFGDQVPITELKGRPFVHGVTDCYAIIRDWMRLERKITIPDFPRDWEWWMKGQNLYMDGFAKAGYSIVPQEQIQDEGPATGDVFFASIGRNVKVINHGGIYTGNGLGLHHITSEKPYDVSRLSFEEPVQRWLKYINMWVRYDDT